MNSEVGICLKCSRSEKEVMAGVAVESKTGDGLREALVRTLHFIPSETLGQ